MPQYPIFARQGGDNNKLDISAATVVKATPGTCWEVNVTTAGTTTGAIYDTNATGSVGAANLVAVIPDVVGSYTFTFPCLTGITVVPGTGQVVSVAFA